MKRESRKYLKVLINLLIGLIVLLLFMFLIPRVIVFFMPFLIGWIIAMIANPLVRFFEVKLSVKRKASTAFVIIVVIGTIALLGYLVGNKLIDETIGLISSLPSMWNSLEEDFKAIGTNWDIFYNRLPEDIQQSLIGIGEDMDTYVAQLVGSIGTPTVNAVGNFAKNIPSAIIGIIMCFLSAYFFTTDRAYVGHMYRSIVPKYIQDKWDLIFGSLRTAVGGYFKAQLKIECWIYLLLLIGLMFLKINYAVLIALGIAVLDFLPFFGTGAVMLPWAAVKFLSGDYKMTIGLLIIWGVGQLVRQIIQPKIVGDSIGMKPIPTLFLLFIGYKVASVIGMILAVPIGIILVNLNEAGVFDNVKQSIRILVCGLNEFRRFEDDEKL